MCSAVVIAITKTRYKAVVTAMNAMCKAVVTAMTIAKCKAVVTAMCSNILIL